MAIFLRVLPDSYREHFAHTELRTTEEMAAKADSLWEMQGGAAAMVAAVSHPASPRRPSPGRCQQDGSGGGDNNRGRGNGGRGGGQRQDRSPTPGGALQRDTRLRICNDFWAW
jgi:hypothetical protein